MLIRPTPTQASLPDDNRVVEPPDPLPNSEVKRNIADGSVGLPHVRVGHRQASNPKRATQQGGPFFMAEKYFKKTKIKKLRKGKKRDALRAKS